MSTAQERFGFLDTMRFVGASVVALFHFIEKQPENPVFDAILHSGAAMGAVMFFFIVSGFVMPMTMQRPMGAAEFALRRLFRLIPLYAFALGLITVLAIWGVLPNWQWILSAPAQVWLPNLFLVQDFVGMRPILGVSWTLAIEIIWYTIFFAFFVRFGSRTAPLLGILAPAGLVALALVSVAIDQRIPLGRPGMIYAGVLGLHFYRYVAGEIDFRRLLLWVASFLAVTTFTNSIAFGYFAHEQVRLMPVLASWWVAPILFTIVVSLPAIRRSTLLNQGPLPFLGMISYSIYLLHPIVIALVYAHVAEGLRLPAFLAGLLVLCLIGYFGIEKPGVETGRALAKRWAGQPGRGALGNARHAA